MTIKTIAWNQAVVFAQRLDRAVTVTEWSDNEGEDCLALLGCHHVLWREGGKWHVQTYTEYSDSSVGIFGQLEPGELVGSHADALVALHNFFTRHFAAKLDEALGDFWSEAP